MSLTRKMLKAMGIEEEKIDQIIEAHSETVESLKADRDAYKEDAGKLKTVQRELDDLKAKNPADNQKKLDDLQKEFDTYKATIEAQKSRADKEKAARAFYEAKGITGKSLEIAVRGSRSEIEALELDGEKIKDDSALDALVKGDFSGLVVTTTTKGAPTATPPTNNGGTGSGKTREEILAIRDGSVRRAEIAKNPHLFPELPPVNN